jgi:ribose transport system substrate-binding protein
VHTAVKIGAISAIGVLLSLTSGCSRHDNSERYILVTVNTKLPYWKVAASGLAKAAEQYGVKMDVRGPERYDPTAEAQELRNSLALKPAGLLVSVADRSLMGPAIDEAVNAGIPVLTIDSDAPESKRLYFIGTNNMQAGVQGGKRLAEKLHGKGNVVFYTMPEQPNLDDRLRGYKDVFEDYPGIQIVEVFNIKGDSGNAFDRTVHYLTDKSARRVDAFVCLESSAGRDVAEALRRQQHASDRIVIAMDADDDILTGIKQGFIDATVTEKPFTMAFYGLKALDDIHHYPEDLKRSYASNSFSPFPTFVDTGSTLVDKSNVDEYLKAEQESTSKQ